MGGEVYQKTKDGEDIYFISPKFYDIINKLPVRENIIYNSFIGNLGTEDDDEIKENIMKEFHCDMETSEEIYNNFIENYPDKKYNGYNFHRHLYYDDEKSKNTGEINSRFILFRTDKANLFWKKNRITQKYMEITMTIPKDSRKYLIPCCSINKKDLYGMKIKH